MKRKTISKPVSIAGKGLHTGNTININLIPSTDAGIKFTRTDLTPSVSILADPSNVINTQRSTTIGKKDVSITTVEHILAALSGKGITNAIIEVDGPEIPILDGSALPFVNMINEAGIETLDTETEPFVVTETITLKDEESGSEIIAMPSDHFEIQVIIDFPNENVAEQTASLENIADFEAEIANCRTFVFTDELEALIESNLIKGGDLGNALVIAEKDMTQDDLDILAEKLGVQKMTLPDNGILSNEDLFHYNEMARHKLLDVIGDLSLLGRPIQGKVIAIKPGHKINTEFAALLKQKVIENKRLKGKPIYDPTLPPIKNLEEIKSMLPHRYPFLLVDKIISLESDHVVGVKNVTFNENFFQGHFPGNPVFPGVLQMEALAQTGGILALSTVDDPHNWDTYFLKMNNVKFKNMVLPGDSLILKMELLSPIRRGIVHMQGTAYVGNKIVSEGELTAQIVRRK